MRKLIGVAGWSILILGVFAGALVFLNAPKPMETFIPGTFSALPRMETNTALREIQQQRGLAIIGSSVVTWLVLVGLEQALDHLVAIRAHLEKMSSEG